jgi:predicted Zn-dependent protease
VERSDTQGEGTTSKSPASPSQALTPPTPLPLAGEGRVQRSDTQGEGSESKSPRPLPTRLPKKPTADLLRIGWLLVDSGQPTAALAIFAEAIAADDRSAIAWAAYGLALAKAGEHTKAQEALFKAAMRAPKDIEVSCALGEAALLRGDFTAAHKALATCCTLDPKMETPCGLRARALLRKAQKQLSDI